MTARRRTAILISGRGSNMTALIDAARAADYPAEISLVFSNKADAGGLQRARAAGIATEAIDSKTFGKDREAFERALHAVLERHNIEIVCLAGFMRLLTPWFVHQWHGRMINIHPALLPAYPGLHTHERALADGATTHGATVHFVVPEMDAGPIIAQGSVPVKAGETSDALAARVLSVEHVIFPAALKAVANGDVRLDGERCVDANGKDWKPAIVAGSST
jgi:phosphoribosylglycinamide formyltransferase-1